MIDSFRISTSFLELVDHTCKRGEKGWTSEGIHRRKMSLLCIEKQQPGVLNLSSYDKMTMIEGPVFRTVFLKSVPLCELGKSVRVLVQWPDMRQIAGLPLTSGSVLVSVLSFVGLVVRWEHFECNGLN